MTENLLWHFECTGPTEKGKMLDITRDKPIKVAVRVVVPVRDHPKVSWTYENDVKS